MNTYHLYLDESETHNSGLNRVFSIAGIAVEENFHNTVLTHDLNSLKSKIWSDYSNCHELILHEKDVRFAQNPFNVYKLDTLNTEYRRFKDFSPSQALYTGLEKIIKQKDISIIGCCVNIDELHKNYYKDILSDKSLIAMQVIMENFCHFLKTHNGVGKIFYESIGEAPDKAMSMRFHQIKAMGTMYVNSYAVQKLILNIEFPQKKDNIAGLQIADFLPNDIARSVLGKRKHQFNLNKVINRSMYDGGLNRKDRFGVKIIPRVI